MEFKPLPSPGKWITLAGSLVLGGLAGWLFSLLRGQSVSPRAFWLGLAFLASLLGGAVLLYWTIAAFRLRYRLNRNGLVIRWGAGWQRVPMERIRAVMPGSEAARAVRRFRGLHIPGLRAGQGDVAGLGPARFFAVAPMSQSVVVKTDRRAYVISPAEISAFIDAWQRRAPLGTTQTWPEAFERPGFWGSPLWQDSWTWGLVGAATALFAALAGFVFHRYQALPQSLPVHFDALGQADRIANKQVMLFLLLVGGSLLLFNSLLGAYLHRRERLGAYLLWGLGGAVQAGLFIAMQAMGG
ncbi:MAG: PH domain-containing protein [Anaerolineae bacterium]